jgi:hypothetical protein
MDRRDPGIARADHVGRDRVADVDDAVGLDAREPQRGIEDPSVGLRRPHQRRVDDGGHGDPRAGPRVADGAIAQVLLRVPVRVGDHDHSDAGPAKRGDRWQRLRRRLAPQDPPRAAAIGEVGERALRLGQMSLSDP